MENSQEKKHSENILIIEDDSFIGGLLQRKFSQENYKIFSSINTEGALAILQNNKIDLIILDIILPGVDGLTFLKDLKKNTEYKKIPVLITSNLDQPEEIESGIKEGAVDYIVKANTTPGEIVEKVKSILGKKQAINEY